MGAGGRDELGGVDRLAGDADAEQLEGCEATVGTAVGRQVGHSVQAARLEMSERESVVSWKRSSRASDVT